MVKRPQMLVWVSAGRTEKLDFEFNDYDYTLLIEPTDKMRARLEKDSAENSNIVVSKHGLSIHGGEQTFYHYSLPEFSCFSKPAGITELYPGIKLLHSGPKDTNSLSDIFSSEIGSDCELTMVLDFPDVKLEFLETICKLDQDHKVKHLYLPISGISLFDGAANKADIKHFLTDKGFDLLFEDNEDPDISFSCYKLNRLYEKLKKLKADLFVAEESKSSLMEQNKLLIKNNDIERNEVQLEIKNLNQRYKKSIVQLEEKNKLLTNNISLLNHDSRALLDANKSLSAEKETWSAQVKKLNSELKVLKNEIKKCETINEKLDGELVKLKILVKNEEEKSLNYLSQITNCEAQMAVFDEKIENKEKETIQIQSQLEFANKELLKLKGANTELSESIQENVIDRAQKIEQIDSLQDKVTTLQNRLCECESDFADQINDKQNHITNIQSKLDEKMEEEKSLRLSNEEYLSEIEVGSQNLNVAQKTCDNLKVQIASSRKMAEFSLMAQNKAVKDLEDLRDKYKLAVNDSLNQQLLLETLKTKLEEYADFCNYVYKSCPELFSNTQSTGDFISESKVETKEVIKSKTS